MKNLYKISILFLVALLASCQNEHVDSISFNNDVRPILNEKCLACHGGVKSNGGFSMLFEEDAFAKTQSGNPAIVPGNHKKSELFKRVVNSDPELRMPFEEEPLSQEEIDILTRWIDEGALWEKHWAYIPPDKSIEPPEINNSKWSQNSIDQFIYAKLIEKGLQPSDEADKATLVRRLYLDLIGLPPTFEESQEFLQDTSENAYEKMVDRLLESEHFGERWALMWMDLARYADSKGYEKDTNREIWKYRDWLIDAFNQDMPFDQFSIEQLAGDLLPEPTHQQLIATAFHRNTLANDEGGTSNEEFRVASVLERVATTYEVWQGTTMACVQCHSHPYDPFRHEEFYQSMAFFNNSEDKDAYFELPKLFTYSEENKEKVRDLMGYIKAQLVPEDLFISESGFLYDQKEELLNHVGYLIVEAETYDESSSFIELVKGLKAIDQVQDNSWIRFDEVDLSNIEAIGFLASTQLDHAGKITIKLDSLTGRNIGEVQITKTGKWDFTDSKIGLKEFKTDIAPIEGKHDVFFLFNAGEKFVQHLFHIDKITYFEKDPRKAKYDKEFLQKLEDLASVPTTSTPILQELKGKDARKTFLFERGSWLSHGEEVASGIPNIYGFEENEEPSNRLEFAQWLASPENPLSARVAVNRFWEQIFGFGLVASMEEFGSQGDRPSHPELMDWLSVRFVEKHQWHMKPLIRELVLSETYQQSSEVNKTTLEKDPQNQWLSRSSRTRLSSEQIRDQILTVSGLLVREVGGPSVANQDVNGGWRGIPSWVIQGDEGLNRRSLYTLWKRVTPPMGMITFDSPDRSVCASRRIRTNTPLQALNLLNDETFFTASIALAKKIASAEKQLDKQLEFGYRQVMSCEIQPEKLELLIQLYNEAFAYYDLKKEDSEFPQGVLNVPGEDKYKLAALTIVSNALLNLDEFIVKK